MIDDSVIANDLWCEHSFEFFARIGPMRAELIEQRNSLAWNVAQMLKQPWDERADCASEWKAFPDGNLGR